MAALSVSATLTARLSLCLYEMTGRIYNFEQRSGSHESSESFVLVQLREPGMHAVKGQERGSRQP